MKQIGFFQFYRIVFVKTFLAAEIHVLARIAILQPTALELSYFQGSGMHNLPGSMH
jgi:hypothetical protein